MRPETDMFINRMLVVVGITGLAITLVLEFLGVL